MMRVFAKISGLTLVLMSVAADAAETITYSYDARGRLKQVARTGTVNNGTTTAYAYDKTDNRTTVTTTTGGGGGMAAITPPSPVSPKPAATGSLPR